MKKDKNALLPKEESENVLLKFFPEKEIEEEKKKKKDKYKNENSLVLNKLDLTF